MTGEDVRQLLAYMAATWRVEFTEAQVAVWAETFQPVKPAHAREALRWLKGETSIVPSHAQFLEAAAAARRKQEHADSARAGLPMPSERVGPDEFRRGLEAARATLIRRRDAE